ncbi:MAG: host-nuclease inhibitor Gam family protein [Xanthomonadales bacterium]|nr:host-nuclease inhibitor Gam family protein [Xanthomonadales bacterium]
MSSRNARIKTEAAPYVPKNRQEVDEAIAEIGRLQRERETIQTAMNDRLSAARSEFEDQAKPAAEAIKTLSHGVQVWAEANRAELTKDGRTKTVRLGNGELRWRTRPPSVGIRAMTAVLKALRELGLDRFIRTKEEVDKEAILADQAAVEHVKGITINQGEDFVIVPFATELEEVAP